MPRPSQSRLTELTEAYISSLEHLLDAISGELHFPLGKAIGRKQYVEVVEQAAELLETYAAAMLVSASEGQEEVMNELAASLVYQFLTRLLFTGGDGAYLGSLLDREYLDPFLLERDVELRDMEHARPELLGIIRPEQFYASAYEHELVYLLDGVRLVTVTQAFHQANRAEGQSAELFLKLASILIDANPPSEYGEPGHHKADKLFGSGDRFVKRLLTMLFAGRDFLETRPDQANRQCMDSYLEKVDQFTEMSIPEKMISGRVYSGWGQQWPDHEVLAVLALNSGVPPDRVPEWLVKVEAKFPGRHGLKFLAEHMRDAHASLTSGRATELLPGIREKLVGEDKERAFAELNEGWKNFWLRILDFIDSMTPIQVSESEVSEKRIIHFVFNLVTSFLRSRSLPKLLSCRFATFPRGWTGWDERKKLKLFAVKTLIDREPFLSEHSLMIDMSGHKFAADETRLSVEKLLARKDEATKITVAAPTPTVSHLAEAAGRIIEADKATGHELEQKTWLLFCGELSAAFWKTPGFVPPWDEGRLREVVPILMPSSFSSSTFQGVWLDDSIPLVQYHVIHDINWPKGTMVLVMRESVGEIVTEEFPDVVFNPTPTYRQITLDFKKTLKGVVLDPKSGEIISSAPLDIVPGSDVIGGPIFEETIRHLRKGVDIRLKSQLIVSVVVEVTPLLPSQMVVLEVQPSETNSQ